MHIHRERTRTHWLLAISALAACAAVAPNAPAVAFTFQNGASSGTVTVSVRNTGDDVVFLPRCGDHMLVAIDRRSGDAWTNAAAAFCPANLRMDAIRLDIGAAHVDSILVTPPGTYRLRVAIQPRSSVAPSKAVTSQSFSTE